MSEKRCGKTTALQVIQFLVPRALPTSNITSASIFRAIDAWRPTLLIDEADTFLSDNDELRGILNSGHNRASAFVVRTVGDDHEPAQFVVWGAVAIAIIGELPDTLADRSIAIRMKRKLPDEKVTRFRLDRVDELRTLDRKAVRFASDVMERLKAWDGDAPDSLNDRAADNWRPLLAIADVAGGHWPELARAASVELSRSNDDGSDGVTLLSDIYSIFLQTRLDRIRTDDLLTCLHKMEDRPWSEYRQGKPLTAPQLAKLLRPFAVSPGTIRLDAGGTAKGYKREPLDDAFRRYLPSR